MNNPSTLIANRLFSWIVLGGLLIGIQGLSAIAERSVSDGSSGTWRRTRLGWEQADSLPAIVLTHNQFSNERATELKDSIKASGTLYRVHRLLLPAGAAGFIGCFGSWCLLRLGNTKVVSGGEEAA